MLALGLFLLWVTPLIPWININVFHKHRQAQRGTTHSPFSELFMEPEVSVSLSLMSSLAVSQNISHTSADFCLSFEVCSQGGKRKKVSKHLGVFLKVWFQVCLNHSLFKESFSLLSASHSSSELWLYFLSTTSPIPDSHLPDFIPIPSVLVLGPPLCHCSSQSSTYSHFYFLPERVPRYIVAKFLACYLTCPDHWILRIHIHWQHLFSFTSFEPCPVLATLLRPSV